MSCVTIRSLIPPVPIPKSGHSSAAQALPVPAEHGARWEGGLQRRAAAERGHGAGPLAWEEIFPP